MTQANRLRIPGNSEMPWFLFTKAADAMAYSADWPVCPPGLLLN
jgi:hypothetical protein